MKYFDVHRIWSYCVASILSFLEPISVLLLWTFFFIISDMVTGIYASYCNSIKITSHKMQKTIIKFLMYGGSIMLLEGFDVYFITFAEIGLAKIGATIICGIELYSIFENCYRATGNIVFKVLTQTVKKNLEDKTNIHIDEEEDDRAGLE